LPKISQKALADETDQLVYQILNEGVDGIIGGWPCQGISFAERERSTWIHSQLN